MPIIIKKNAPAPQQGGGMLGGMNPMNLLGKSNPLSGFLGGGSSGGSGIGSLASTALSNPLTAIPAAAVAGATSLSADSASAGTGANAENWLGPLYNIPEAISRGDWGDVMKDGAMGPVGAIYGIATGKDTLKSVMNSLGPIGQVPYLIGKGQMPYSGGKTSKNFMSAFQGRGI